MLGCVGGSSRNLRWGLGVRGLRGRGIVRLAPVVLCTVPNLTEFEVSYLRTVVPIIIKGIEDNWKQTKQ